MYADDIILMSESFDGFQNILNTMSLYTEKWGLAVNVKKSKVVFRRGGTFRNDEKWLCINTALDIVHQFCYLGVFLHYNCKFLIR